VSYAKALVTVRHLLDGGFRVYYGGKAIAEAKAAPPTAPAGEPRSLGARKRSDERKKQRAEGDEGVTESLTC